MGSNGTESPVYQKLIKDDTLFAAADNGFFYIAVNTPFISNFGLFFISNLDDGKSVYEPRYKIHF